MGAPIGGLVPIEAVESIFDLSIDSIRVRVSGVEEMNEASQVRIAYIAQQIRDVTGLHVDIVLGSSKEVSPSTFTATTMTTGRAISRRSAPPWPGR